MAVSRLVIGDQGRAMDAQHVYRIVLIDDSRMARLGLREQLNRTAEFRIVGEATSMVEGLELVGRLTPDLVLLDISLPDGSGVQACRRLVAGRPDMRVLILSVYDDPAVIREAIAAGAQGYMLKDTPVAMWRNAMRRVAAGGAVLGPQLIGQVLMEVREMANGLSTACLADLSPQERRLLPLVAEGRTNKEIAVALSLSEKTVKNYISNMYSKLGITRRSQVATLYARTLPSGGFSAEDCA
ncbi:response regulator [Nitrospira defluvii]|uniref:DNA-binding response regulator n=1 Tax=Nitrospira defluvii TaxID=330214 RepID=A0ABN7KM33_9BACT|nr:response regulator transcription factor [Nitrospira defluvii]CAE6700599.1 DNA-binding response regulator [Nitrospira defluvii]